MNRKLILTQIGQRDYVFAWIAKLASIAPTLTIGEITELQAILRNGNA